MFAGQPAEPGTLVAEMRGNREYDCDLTWHFADETGAPLTITIDVQRIL